MKELYVYYRIGQLDVPAARQQVEAAFDALKRGQAGLHARLLCRAQPGEGQETWMEVYTHPQGITPGLQAVIESATRELPAARVGNRHIEVFEPAASRGTC
jgi:hypothetical protein